MTSGVARLELMVRPYNMFTMIHPSKPTKNHYLPGYKSLCYLVIVINIILLTQYRYKCTLRMYRTN